MKKIFPIIILLVFLAIPILANAADTGGIVPCDGPDCTIASFFVMLARIYDFIVLWIATPLAVLMLIIGGVIIIISAGNPNLAGLGKKMVTAAIIGLALVFCSWLIIDVILGALGYNMGTWWKL